MCHNKLSMAAVVKTSVAMLLGSLLFSTAFAQHQTTKPRTFAQQLVEETASKHPEISGLELAARSQTGCSTIATTESAGLGEKCDKDELGPMKTGKPWVEKEKEKEGEVYDITMPVHDKSGKIIAAAGMDFKPQPEQTAADVTSQAQKIVQEIEQQIASKEKLFEPVK